MIKNITLFIFLIFVSAVNIAYAQSTTRITEFSNSKVNVWKTVIHPKSNQVLSMHRHDYDRVLVALSNGLLKITNDKGDIHYLKLKKNRTYYLKKDLPDELHQDENMTKHPIIVVVIELKE
ncbi:MAG: hypothetical protein K0U24_01580 [Gammaproteobacteria bacterium]|nr:hypothetical protein [Gammaproteobacteria bacterium]MCH9762919.1 hypothetical protein [Gammaproteobacteria bacterium]